MQLGRKPSMGAPENKKATGLIRKTKAFNVQAHALFDSCIARLTLQDLIGMAM